MKKRLAAVLTVAAMLLCMSGCSFFEIGVDSRLRAPHAAGEQSAIQSALEQHIYAGGEASSVSYVLKYPKMGEYRSAFVMKDMTGDGKDDALAFYALQPEGTKTHIALLCKEEGEWHCVADIEGLATEIERIQFGDLNGDKRPEMFAGFSMYNTRDRRLVMYTWEEDHFNERYTDTYTGIIVDKVVDETHDDLLLFRLNSEESKAVVTLLSMNDNTVTEKGSAFLDGNIRQFGDYSLSVYEDGTRAVFQDCFKDNRSAVTELIIWDGKQLTAPLYNPSENITTLSARESDLPSMDIDGDGITEWPRSLRLPGDELVPTEDMTLWLTEWSTWNPAKQQIASVATTIVNPYDGYYLDLPEDWIGTVTADYDQELKQLTVSEVENGTVGKALFKIVAFGVREDNPFKQEERYLFLDATDKTRYELWYDKENDRGLIMEEISDLFHFYGTTTV